MKDADLMRDSIAAMLAGALYFASFDGPIYRVSPTRQL
jgi:hypothetical protein